MHHLAAGGEAVVGMGSGHANYLKLLKNKRKNSLIRPYIELFRGKKSVIQNNQWQEQKDTISRGRYGISSTDAINESFCSSLQKIAEDGFSGFLKRKNVDDEWTKNIAVGNRSFIDRVK